MVEKDFNFQLVDLFILILYYFIMSSCFIDRPTQCEYHCALQEARGMWH